MGINTLFSEDWAVVACIDPDAYAIGTQNSDEIDMSLWESVAAVVMVGDRGAASTVDFAFHSASTTGGSFSAISGKSITQIVDTSPLANASNKQQIVNLRGSEVTSNNQFVRGVLTLASAASPQLPVDACVLILGRAKFAPADDNDLSSVSEIVA